MKIQYWSESEKIKLEKMAKLATEIREIREKKMERKKSVWDNPVMKFIGIMPVGAFSILIGIIMLLSLMVVSSEVAMLALVALGMSSGIFGLLHWVIEGWYPVRTLCVNTVKWYRSVIPNLKKAIAKYEKEYNEKYKE